MREPVILLTGFEPFGEHRINPSAAIAAALDGELCGGACIRSATLPVDSARLGAALREALAATRPALVLALGLAAGRAALNVERIAVNVRDFAIADNAGTQVVGEPVVPGGPAAYLATVPVRQMVVAMRAVGVPACLSDTAGTYLCNQALYMLCHLAATWQEAGPAPQCGFIHVPCLPEQVAALPDNGLGREGWPTMSLATMIAGVRVALATASAALPALATSERE